MPDYGFSWRHNLMPVFFFHIFDYIQWSIFVASNCSGVNAPLVSDQTPSCQCLPNTSWDFRTLLSLAPAQPWRFLFRTSARLPMRNLYCNKLIYLACFAHPEMGTGNFVVWWCKPAIMLDMEPSDIWLTIISGIRWFLLDCWCMSFLQIVCFAEPRLLNPFHHRLPYPMLYRYVNNVSHLKYDEITSEVLNKTGWTSPELSEDIRYFTNILMSYIL